MTKWHPLTNEIVKQHEHYVVKANELIQHSRNTMPLQQYKLLLYMISKIKRDDEPNILYSINIKDFCLVANIDYTSGKNYNDIKEALWNIDKQYIWMKKPEAKKEIRLRWFNRLQIDYGSGIIEYSYHEDIHPYLFNLISHYEQYQLMYVLAMKSKYAVYMYELMKSYQNVKNIISIPLEEVKRSINAEHYTVYKDFKKRALTPSLEEINKYCSDISVKAIPHTEGGSRSYSAITFIISTPTEDEVIERREKLQEELGYNWY